VLEAVARLRDGAPDEFTLRRARAELAGLSSCAEKSNLSPLLLAAEDGAEPERIARPLVSYACELERTRRLPEADAAAMLAVALDALAESGLAALLHGYSCIGKNLQSHHNRLNVWATVHSRPPG
jgi:hypothetical protein